MVAVDLPTPWLVHGGRAKDAEKIEPFPKKLPVAGDFPQHLVELHDVARRVESAHAQTRPEQLERRVALGCAHLVQRHAVAQRILLPVGPLAPLLRVNGMEGHLFAVPP